MENYMDRDYISRRAVIDWLMPYVHIGEKVDPEVLIGAVRYMPAADVVPVDKED